jgi:hypothetical protein
LALDTGNAAVGFAIMTSENPKPLQSKGSKSQSGDRAERVAERV